MYWWQQQKEERIETTFAYAHIKQQCIMNLETRRRAMIKKHKININMDTHPRIRVETLIPSDRSDVSRIA